MLGGELTHPLGYPPGGTKPADTRNHRNGTFEPQIIPKHARRFTGIDDKTLALAVLPDGSRDILGIWIEQTEGAKVWMKVFSDLKSRGTGHSPPADHQDPRPLPERRSRDQLIWLALRNITKKWDRGANYWKTAMTQFAIPYDDRFTKPAV